MYGIIPDKVTELRVKFETETGRKPDFLFLGEFEYGLLKVYAKRECNFVVDAIPNDTVEWNGLKVYEAKVKSLIAFGVSLL